MARAGLADSARSVVEGVRSAGSADPWLDYYEANTRIQLGGWKNPQTILICYQHPDQQQMKEALEDRRKASGEV